MIRIKTPREISCIMKSGAIAALVLRELSKAAKPGVVTMDLELMARRLIKARRAKPSFIGYNGYEYAICISINDEVVHGLPSNRVLKKGDLVGIDIGVNLAEYYSDCATTISVGPMTKDIKKLIYTTRESLDSAIRVIRPGIRVGEIEEMTGNVLRRGALRPILSLSGHGVGLAVHEDPSIKSDGKAASGEIVRAGMVFAIEPMATTGCGQVKVGPDGWSVKTVDQEPAAHFEHTVAVTKRGVKILTGSR